MTSNVSIELEVLARLYAEVFKAAADDTMSGNVQTNVTRKVEAELRAKTAVEFVVAEALKCREENDE